MPGHANSSSDGDLRFAAELASHAVFAAPENTDAKTLLADVLEQLGYGSENATWRNAYLTGALELREGVEPTPMTASAGMAPAMTTTQLFDSIAIRINGPRAWDTRLSINWKLTDTGETYHLELSNGALIHIPTTNPPAADLTVTLTRPQLVDLLFTGNTDGIELTGDATALPTLLSLTDNPDPSFPIVTP